MTATDERRREPRCEVTIFLCRGGEEDLFLGIARNIGTGGLFVETSERFEVGSTQQITFVSGGELRSCQVRVLRHEAEGMALEFSGEDPEAAAAVRKLVGAEPA